MTRPFRGAAGLACLAALLAPTTAPAAFTYLGTGSLPGTSTDLSGLSGALEDGTPRNLLGGIGSGIAYTGSGNRYVLSPDRGPNNGLTSYVDRLQTVDITVTPGGGVVVTPVLVGTTLLTNESGAAFTGNSAAFDATNSPASLRLDPEGIRVGRDGATYVSDEYGPFLDKFDPSGRRVSTIAIPEKFLIAHPNADSNAEIAGNTALGRVTNRGMEGLAITPDGSTLYGMMQNPLAQDGGRNGLNDRILKVDLATGKTQEFVYQLSNKSLGVNEILAVNDHQFLVIERDGNAGNAAAFKKVFLIDVDGASDVSGLATLPLSGLPAGVTAVGKSSTPILDLLNPAFGLVGASFPEKIEGLAFGPDLADGRHLLIVTNDNDFITTQPNNFYAFAFDQSDLPGYTPQQFAAVPEPASIALLAVGLGALLALRRRKSRD